MFLDGLPYLAHDPQDAIEAGIRVVYQELNLLTYLHLARALNVAEILVSTANLRDGLLMEMAVGGAWTEWTGPSGGGAYGSPGSGGTYGTPPQGAPPGAGYGAPGYGGEAPTSGSTRSVCRRRLSSVNCSPSRGGTEISRENSPSRSGLK